MAAVVQLALLGYFGVAMFLFTRLPKHRAVIAGIMLGTLFLPEIHNYNLMPEAPSAISLGFFKLTKVNATTVGVLFAALVFDAARVKAFRLRWFDAPMLAWCI